MLGSSSDRSSQLLPFTPIVVGVVYLLCALILMRYGRKISFLMFREDTPIQVALPADWASDLFKVFIKAAGVIVLVQGIPELIKVLPRILFLSSGASPLPRELWGEALSAVTSLALGVHLLSGGKLILSIGSRVSQGS